MSQFEWAKQASVRNVRDKVAIDGDGKADPAAPRNTVEVYADFTNGDAFFGLTSYLSYAEQQLIESRKWILESNERLASPHKFPWRSIDTKKVKAKGFLPEQFHFSSTTRRSSTSSPGTPSTATRAWFFVNCCRTRSMRCGSSTGRTPPQTDTSG